MNNTLSAKFARVFCLALASLGFAFLAFAQYPASAATNTLADSNPGFRSGLPSALPSTTVFVTNTADSGVGSLRDVVAAANPGDTVNFSLSGCPCVIGLSSEIQITQSLNIVGLGQTMLAVSGSNSVRVFNVITGSPVSFSQLTIRNGRVTGSTDNGAGIRTQTAITLTNITLSNNNADHWGGGLYNEGGTVQVISSTFTSNNGSSLGGGVANYSGNLIVVASTFLSNTADFGGAIWNRETLTLVNSTLTGNSATSIGGAIENENSGNATILNSTFSGNSAGNGKAIYNVTGIPSGVVNITNTIITNSTTTFNCAGVGGGSNNIDIGNSCGFDHPNTNPLLAPLANNGGPTQTMALLPGSPAIDAGDNTTCAAAPVNGRDQRGQPRGALCDIGAYELVKIIFFPLILR